MNARRVLTVLAAGAAVALSVGLVASPAGAQDSTSTSLGISPSATTYGDEQAVTFSSTVTDTTTPTSTPTGTVTVATGSTTLCIIDLSTATSCTTGATTLDASGTAYAVTASYTSDDTSSFDNSASGSEDLTVGQASRDGVDLEHPDLRRRRRQLHRVLQCHLGRLRRDLGGLELDQLLHRDGLDGELSWRRAPARSTASVAATTDYAAATRFGRRPSLSARPRRRSPSRTFPPRERPSTAAPASPSTYTVTPDADTGTTSVVSNSATTCTVASGVGELRRGGHLLADRIGGGDDGLRRGAPERPDLHHRQGHADLADHLEHPGQPGLPGQLRGHGDQHHR